jgi:predicted nucleic acid-binding protein
MYTLDANIFVRDLDPYDPEHRACATLLEQLTQRSIPIVLPVLVLAEVAGSISRTRRDPFRGRLAAAAISAKANVQLVLLDEQLAQAAAELAADYRLRGADAVYVAVARQAGTTLVTLDAEQRARAAAVVPTRAPAEALAELPPPFASA